MEMCSFECIQQARGISPPPPFHTFPHICTLKKLNFEGAASPTAFLGADKKQNKMVLISQDDQQIDHHIYLEI